MAEHTSIADRISEQQLVIAQLTTKIHFEEKPELEIRYGNVGREKSIQDVAYHVSYLAEAIRSESEDIFNSYIVWSSSVLNSRNVPIETLIDNLYMLDRACKKLLLIEDSNLATTYITSSIVKLKHAKPFPPSYLTEENPLFDSAKKYLAFLLAGNRNKAQVLINELIENKQPLPIIFEYIFEATQHEVGLLWQTNKITVAHEHYCTASTQQIMSSLYPYIFNAKRKGLKMIACAISGDLHELGIRMVSDMFELDGWDTYYLGANMPDINIITSIKEQKTDVLALSVTMPFHLGKVERLIKKIRNDKNLDNLIIIVGGYTFNSDPTLWKRLGADGMTRNGTEAVGLANRLIKDH
ncbi:MAG: cobalamin B12-binding domain-containing protein [Chitinophagaceae bacterium]